MKYIITVQRYIDEDHNGLLVARNEILQFEQEADDIEVNINAYGNPAVFKLDGKTVAVFPSYVDIRSVKE